MRFGSAGNFRGRNCNDYARRERGTARTLTVLAVAVEHCDRLLLALVANGSARATTSKRCRHI